jgi:hypothetical protein
MTVLRLRAHAGMNQSQILIAEMKDADDIGSWFRSIRAISKRDKAPAIQLLR